VSSRVSWFN